MIIKQIDTEKKEITINESVNMGDLVKELKNLFKDNWKDWNINVEKEYYYWPFYEPYRIYTEVDLSDCDSTSSTAVYDNSTYTYSHCC